jgi:hypothetical protein
MFQVHIFFFIGLSLDVLKDVFLHFSNVSVMWVLKGELYEFAGVFVLDLSAEIVKHNQEVDLIEDTITLK